MDELYVSHDYAYESPSSFQRYPGISEDAFQRKSKQKLKKGKMPNDDGKTDVTSDVSTVDETCDASTNAGSASNLQSQSSNSTVGTKKCKKRDRQLKKQTSERSENAHGDFNVIFERPPAEQTEYLPFATLSCPVCSDPECVLNVAATCPLLRHNEGEVTGCNFCEANCQCIKCKTKLLPVSGLVARDENGVAETLLKKNGGPIENSSEWANRKRWVVPYGISWDHQVGEWITSKMLDTSKSTLEGAHRKRSKSRLGKRKSRHTTPTSTLSQVANSTDNFPQEDKSEDPKVLLEGNGFKIIARGQEKVLVNFDTKNCKYLGCTCKKDSSIPNCGCDAWREEGHDKCIKKGKPSKMKKQSVRASLVKETSHRYVEIKDCCKVEQKDQGGAEKIDKQDEVDGVNEDKTEGTGTRKHSAHTKDKSPDKSEDKKGKKPSEEDIKTTLHALSGKDLRHASRVDVLEEHLQSTLGTSYRNENEPNEQYLAACPSGGRSTCPSTGQGVAEVMMIPMEMLGPCMCAERYCYTSA